MKYIYKFDDNNFLNERYQIYNIYKYKNNIYKIFNKFNKFINIYINTILSILR